jgi:alpha-beta hydrolase superfamily lysophospholipase
VFKNAGFENFDKEGDGFFDVNDMKLPTKPYLDAIDQENYAVLDQWAKTAAGVATPAGWFKDHFSYQPMWTFLSKLDVPIGLFQGSLDNATSMEGVKKLEEQAKQAGKTNMHFHYFEGLDHTLNIGSYFARGTMPAGHTAILEFITSQVARK